MNSNKNLIFSAQHGISPDCDPNALKDVQPLLAAAVAYRSSRDRNRSKDNVNRSRDSSSQDLNKADLRDSLLGQALEAGTTLSVAPVIINLSNETIIICSLILNLFEMVFHFQ